MKNQKSCKAEYQNLPSNDLGVDEKVFKALWDKAIAVFKRIDTLNGRIEYYGYPVTVSVQHGDYMLTAEKCKDGIRSYRYHKKRLVEQWERFCDSLPF